MAAREIVNKEREPLQLETAITCLTFSNPFLAEAKGSCFSFTSI
jgi:hypothetical protein